MHLQRRPPPTTQNFHKPLPECAQSTRPARPPDLDHRNFEFVTPMVLRPSEIPAKTEKAHRDRQEKYICSYLGTDHLRGPSVKSSKIFKNRQKSSKSHDFAIFGGCGQCGPSRTCATVSKSHEITIFGGCVQSAIQLRRTDGPIP